MEKSKKRKDALLLIPPRGPRRAEMTGANLSTNADHLSFYKRSSKIVSSITIAAKMHSSHQVHKSPQETWHPHSSVTSFTVHHSPFTIPVQVAHSGVLYDCFPVTTCSCLPPQLHCHNTSSCDNIGRTLVLFPNFQIAIVFQSYKSY